MKAIQERFEGRLSRFGLPILLMLLSLALYLPTISTERVVNDSQAAAAAAWRIATTGAPWMEGVETSELEGHRDPDIWIIEGADGHLVHNRTPGTILPAVPFYLLLNSDTDPAAFKIWVGGAAAAFLTALAGVLMFLGLRKGLGQGPAFLGTCAVLFASPLWSVGADALWTQNLTLLAVAGGVWAVVNNRWALSGLFFALGIFARAHFAVVAAVVGLYLGWVHRDWRIVTRVGFSSAIGLAMLVVWNRAVFGFWSIRGGYSHEITGVLLGESGTFSYHVANAAAFLVWPSRGLLIWTPVILLLLPSVLAHWKRLPVWARAFTLGGVLYSIVQLRINDFHGGIGLYGYRVALELLVCLAPAMIYAYRYTSTVARYAIGVVLGIQFAAFALGASVGIQYILDEEEHVAANAFVLALIDRPIIYGTFTVACGVAGYLATAFMMKRSTNSSESKATLTVG